MKSAMVFPMGGQLFNFSGRITGFAVGIALASMGVQAQGFNDYGDIEFAVVEQQRGLPVRGTTTSAVLEQFGEPEQRKGPVGTPSISVWHYESFDVYFENQLVITSVDKQDTLPFELEGITQ